MADVARRAVIFRATIVGEFEYRCLVAQRPAFILGCSKKDKRKSAFMVFGAPNLDEPKPIAIESQTLIDVADSNHRLQKVHR